MVSRRSVLVGAGATALVTGFPYIARSQPIRMRLPHATGLVHPGHISSVSFKDALEERLPGEVEVQIFPNRQLGDDRQNLESAITGTTELGLASTVLFPLVTALPELDAWQLPFLIRDYDHFQALTESDVGQKMLDSVEPAGLVGLGIHEIGQRHFLSSPRAITKTADFEGVKTRIVPVPLHQAIWEATGAAPVGLPYGEVYAAMQTNVIDAVEINVSSVLAENLWEVGTHFTLTGHYPWPSMIVANKPFFDGLPAEVQQAMREAGLQSIHETYVYAKAQEMEGRDEMREKGMEIYELEDHDEMRGRMQPILDEWAEKSPLIAEFIETAQSI